MYDNDALIDLGDATQETREPPKDVALDSQIARGYEDGAL
jgi:hypothetical protein